MFCPKCGNRIHDASLYCASCGTRLSDLGIAPVAPPSAEPVSLATPGAVAVAAVNVYGGFWRRVGASIIDSLMMYAVMFVSILAVAGNETDNDADTAAAELGVILASNVFAWLYSALMESSSRQATLGKMALGIKVTCLNGQRIGFGRATGRYLGKYISSITLCIGFVMAAFTQRRQALHDMIAGTLVLRNDTNAELLAAHPIAPKVAGWAVALLIFVVAAVPGGGILAAIAIPAYQDYTVRAEVSDALISATEHKAAVAEAVAGGTDWQDISSETLGLDLQASSKYVESVEVITGAVVLTFGDAANAKISGGRLVLVPGLSAGGDVVWVCGYGAAPEGVQLAIEGHEQYSDLEPKYLPAACR